MMLADKDRISVSFPLPSGERVPSRGAARRVRGLVSLHGTNPLTRRASRADLSPQGRGEVGRKQVVW